MPEDNINKKLFTCKGKGGTYELIGYADYGVFISSLYTSLGTACGAGTSRGEQLFIFQDKEGELYYTNAEIVSHLPHAKKPVYKDVKTGLLYYREPGDFDKRMLPTTE